MREAAWLARRLDWMREPVLSIILQEEFLFTLQMKTMLEQYENTEKASRFEIIDPLLYAILFTGFTYIFPIYLTVKDSIISVLLKRKFKIKEDNPYSNVTEVVNVKDRTQTLVCITSLQILSQELMQNVNRKKESLTLNPRIDITRLSY